MSLRLSGDFPQDLKADSFHFDRYLDPLVSLLTNKEAETPFTIGIFGSWGSGKSSLLRMLKQRLETEFRDDFVLVEFNPWTYRDEENMLVPLLHTLHDALNEDKKERFLNSAKKIGEVLLRLGADELLKRATVGAVSLAKLDKMEKQYLESRGIVRSEIRGLHKTLQTEADEVHKRNARIVLFIDDLDRCEPDEIIDVLESIKLFFDLQHVFIILAVDKEVIDRGIEVKYGKFKFAKERRLSLGSEYLEKMVQLPLQLFPLHRSQVRKYIQACSPPEAVLKHLDLLDKVLLPNPRKIKRILNILTLTSLIPGPDLMPEAIAVDGLLVRLAVLQVQAAELYSSIIEYPELLKALDRMYAKPRTLNPDDALQFKDFGNCREAIQKICQKFDRPESFLAPLFPGSGFSKLTREQLADLLSLLGA